MIFSLLFCSSSQNSSLTPLNCGSRFMSFFNSPQVKFYWNIAAYFGFLWLFAVVLMIDFQTFPSWRELLLYIWLGSLVCEEVRQVRCLHLSGLLHIQGIKTSINKILLFHKHIFCFVFLSSFLSTVLSKLQTTQSTLAVQFFV